MPTRALPTIHQVAKRAGVSTATVSRVLTRPDIVAPGTRKNVLRAVDALGYTPNSVASNLRTLRTHKLLVTVPDISNPFFSQIIQGIEDAALRSGYSVLVGDTQHDEQREEGYARMLKRREADGLIFLGHRLRQKPRAGTRGRTSVRAGGERVRVQPAAGDSGRAHRQRESGRRGDDASLQPRPSGRRSSARSAATGCTA